MNREQILELQIKELEKLIELKDKRISELQFKPVGNLELCAKYGHDWTISRQGFAYGHQFFPTTHTCRRCSATENHNTVIFSTNTVQATNTTSGNLLVDNNVTYT